MTAENGKLVYRRVVLKLSGEALQGDQTSGMDPGSIERIAKELAAAHRLGVQIALVIGAGNLVRGAELCAASGVDRVTADQMGMLATLINGLALRDAFEKHNIPVRLYSSLPVSGLVDAYERHRAIRCLEKGRVVIFVGGTGNPLVTTDSAAALRGVEIGADIVIKATKVDGVYAADPVKNPKAERFVALTYDDILKQRLAVMDYNAILLCRDNHLPLRVFNMNRVDAFRQILLGEAVGTLVSEGDLS